MSIRAYKIIEIKTEKNPTFNCWHDEDIFYLADTEQYNEGGILTFNKEIIEKELEERLKGTKKTGTNEKQQDIINTLTQIIKDMDGESCVEYYCY